MYPNLSLNSAQIRAELGVELGLRVNQIPLPLIVCIVAQRSRCCLLSVFLGLGFPNKFYTGSSRY